jgi:hypothetical protein
MFTIVDNYSAISFFRHSVCSYAYQFDEDGEAYLLCIQLNSGQQIEVDDLDTIDAFFDFIEDEEEYM